jgi:hypothetical protein
LDDDTVTALSSADFDQDLQPGDLGFAKDEVIVVRALRTLSIHSAAIGLGWGATTAVLIRVALRCVAGAQARRWLVEWLQAGKPSNTGRLSENFREKDQQSKALEERLYVTFWIEITPL